MSRIDTNALMQPQNGQNSYPDVNIVPDGFDMPEQQAPAEPEPTEKYLKGIYEGMTNAQQRLNSEQSQMFQALSQDPMVQQMLQARQQGKKMKLVDDVEADPLDQIVQQQDEPEPDWSALAADPSKFAQSLTKTTIGGVTKAVIPLVQGLLNKHLAPLQQLARQVQQISGTVQTFQQERVQGEIAGVRNKNPELFDKLQPVMAQLSGQHPTLTTPELFVLAATRAGIPINGEQQQLQTERPANQTTARPPQQTNPRQQALLAPSGAGMRMNPNARFAHTLDTILANKQFPDLS